MHLANTSGTLSSRMMNKQRPAHGKQVAQKRVIELKMHVLLMYNEASLDFS